MLIIHAILIASLGLLQVDASAIKGHARPHEEARSIKLTPSFNSDKLVKEKAQSAQVPILESTKKIYNDESIRRLVAQQPLSSPVDQALIAPVAQVKPAEVVAPVVPVVAVAAPAVPVAQQAPVEHPVVAKESQVPAVPAVEAKSSPVEPKSGQVEPKSGQVEPKSSQVEPKSSPVEPKSSPVEAKVLKAEELPPQSDRSVPVREQQSAVVVEQVVAKEQVIGAAVQPQSVQAAQVQPEVAKESVLQARKDEAEPPIEVPAPDPQLSLSDPIDSTTKLLIDLDEHVQKFLPAEELVPAQPHKEQSLVAGVDYSPSVAAVEPSGKSAPLVPYSSAVADEPIVPPLPPLEGVEKASAASAPSSSAGSAASQVSSSAAPSATRQGGQNQQNQQQVITQLLDQLDSLQNRIQDTINQLVARRRYVMSALLRPMGTYVRRVRTNLERLQNRVNQLQAAAVSVGGGQNRPGGFVDAAAIETIRRRIDDISKRISDIVNRIRFSLTPTSAPLNSNGRR